MNSWMENKEWRKKVDGKSIYIMRDHNYAFAAWEIERMNGTLEWNEVLVHVDAHLDDVPDSVCIPGILKDIKTYEQALQLAEPFDYSIGTMPEHAYMGIDNFIWPAIARNTIGDVYHISHDPDREYNQEIMEEEIKGSIFDLDRQSLRDVNLSKYLLTHLEKHNKKIYRYNFIEDQQKDQRSFIENTRNKKVILDIDLDYFNESKCYSSKPGIMSESVIRKNLMYLKDLTTWDVITVALSPEHCGGKNACRYLLDIFIEVFGINEEDLISW